MPTARLACLVLCNAADWALMLQVFSGFARSLHIYLSQQRRDCQRQQHWPPAPLLSLSLSPSLWLGGKHTSDKKPYMYCQMEIRRTGGGAGEADARTR